MESRCHDRMFGIDIRLENTVRRIDVATMPWTCISVHIRYNPRYCRRRWHRIPALSTLKCVPSCDILLVVNVIALRIITFSLSWRCLSDLRRLNHASRF